MADVDWDVFVSYAHDDVAVAKDLAAHLEGLGLSAFVAASDVPIGVTFEDYMEKALSEAEAVVALCSSASAASIWTHSEIALAADLALGGEIALVPVFLDPAAAELASPVLKHFAGTDAAAGVASVARVVFDVVERVRSGRDNALSSRWRVPSAPQGLFPTDGLRSVLAAASRCHEDHISTLQVIGPAGVGKTTAAAEFARSSTSFDQTIWVRPLGNTMSEILSALADELAVPETDVSRRRWRYVRRALGQSGAVLFVVDDVGSGEGLPLLVDALEPWDLLITTSRIANSELQGATVEVPGLRGAEVGGQIGRWLQAVSESSTELGPSHPSTLSAKATLGALLLRVGLAAQATEVLEDLLRTSVGSIDSGDPTALGARSSLATAYHLAGRDREALALLVELAADATSALGVKHPTTVAVQANIDTFRARQG